MHVENRTAYPDGEVARIISRGMGGGAVPARVIVSYRSGPSDDRQGFTPFDRTQPTTMHLDRPTAYPQSGAKSWQDELIATAGHEAWHYRNPAASCVHDSCEIKAERVGQRPTRTARAAAPFLPLRRQETREGSTISAPLVLGWAGFDAAPAAAQRTTNMAKKEHPNKRHGHLVRGHIKPCSIRSGGRSRSSQRQPSPRPRRDGALEVASPPSGGSRTHCTPRFAHLKRAGGSRHPPARSR